MAGCCDVLRMLCPLCGEALVIRAGVICCDGKEGCGYIKPRIEQWTEARKPSEPKK